MSTKAHSATLWSHVIDRLRPPLSGMVSMQPKLPAGEAQRLALQRDQAMLEAQTRLAHEAKNHVNTDAAHAHIRDLANASQIDGLIEDDAHARKLLENCRIVIMPFTWDELVYASQRDPVPAHTSAEWEAMVDEWDRVTRSLPLIKDSVVIQTRCGRNVLYLLKGALDRMDRDTAAGRPKLSTRLASAMERFRVAWINRRVIKKTGEVHHSDLPTPKDERHHDFARERAKLGAEHTGVWHLAYWCGQGQRKRGPVVSGDMISGSHRLRATATFMSDLADFQSRSSNLFHTLEPDAFRRYRDTRARLRAQDAAMRTVDPNDHHAFLGLAVVYGVRVLPHRDRSDDPTGFVAMTVLGQFLGGDLIVGSNSLQFRMQYQPGDFVLFSSSVLKHAVTPFVGTRTALVEFAHSDTMNWDGTRA